MIKNLSDHVDAELDLAKQQCDARQRFHHLERAHILSQYATGDHVRVHLAMLRWAREQRDWREGLGQLLRIVGAASKTAFGIVPIGNTGGSNVSAIRPMPLPDDLAQIIARYR